MSKKIWDHACNSLSKFLKGKERICIPVQEDDDDQIIFEALKKGELIERKLREIERKLREAEEVIEFYDCPTSWDNKAYTGQGDHGDFDQIINSDVHDGCGGLRANKFLSKWVNKGV